MNPNALINPSVIANLIAYGGQGIWTMDFTTLDLNCGWLKFQVVDLDIKPVLDLSDSIKLGLVSIGPEVHTIQRGTPELSGKLLVLVHMQSDESVPLAVCAVRCSL
ncbi:hypothetical protein VZT92_011888 [Zoarces viviparus]|uniref:Uncharacterized protein n=1 Tax=Zoarces viviparus TaxID=48416 RepID=A0AAW1F6L0_ZOAVI